MLVSLHDVMPKTLENVERIMQELERHELLPVTLLVVPDAGWTGESLQKLNEFVAAGAEVAGHGWRHVVENVSGVRHKLHSLLISRDVAEHLALSRPDIESLVRRCHNWFKEHDLPAPELYVPPAWAMGSLRRADLDRLPFRQYETLGGVYDVRSRQFRRLPMTGFEADTAFRATTCRAWNRLNLSWAGTSNPVRVAIHPQDRELRLAEDLRILLQQRGRALSYRDINFE
jgi:predicted deacetylase